MDEEGRRNNRSPNQRVTTVPIYDFPSIRECVEVLVDTEGRSGCEARFGRIVNEQLQRYRTYNDMEIGTDGNRFTRN